jgi:lantibiotic modifying enzyme
MTEPNALPQLTTTAQTQSWRPLLNGALAKRARGVLDAIIADLPGPAQAVDLPATLAGGQTGLAVLCAYLRLGGMDDEQNAAQFLEQSIESLSSEATGPSLYGGFTGVAWAAAHLRNRRVIAADEDANQEIDEALLGSLEQSPWREDYDLIIGLVGFGVYALERLPHPMGRAILQRVIDRLEETAERNGHGITWLTRPDLLPEWQRKAAPRGYYNLGLAHGVPGVIALLGAAVRAGVAPGQAVPLLKGAVSWLLSQKLPKGSGHSMFPSWVAPSVTPNDTRLAWCYGDAGIAAALFAAARCLGEAAWEREALVIAHHATQRALETAGAMDGGLCHGAAGLAHIFNRLHQATEKPWLREAAIFWFERLFELRRPAEGIGGYSAVTLIDGRKQHEKDPGLLTGAAGIALALLAAITPIEPAWDRMLLVSIPNGSQKQTLLARNA